jgi:hypothetical protein
VGVHNIFGIYVKNNNEQKEWRTICVLKKAGCFETDWR